MKKYLDGEGLNLLIQNFKDKTYTKEEVNDKIDEIDGLEDRVEKIEKDLYGEDDPNDAGFVVLVNNETQNKIKVHPDNLEQYKEGFTPIGIIVIPTSHDVYETGEAGVMALVAGHCGFPDTGGENSNMMWGHNGVDIGLPNLNVVARQGTMDGDVLDEVDGVSNNGYMPLVRSNMKNGKQCPTDPEAWYYDTNSSSSGYIPSPYLEDGSRNPNYYKTDSPSSPLNAMADFNGKSNTDLILSLTTAQPDWKTADTIINQKDPGYCPAACVCWRFHTMGTSQGDWYLPACGELGYCFSRFDKINSIISQISDIFDIKTYEIDDYYIWTSTEYDSTYARRIGNGTGGGNQCGAVGRNYKSYNERVRPFTRIKFESSGKFLTKDEASCIAKGVNSIQQWINPIKESSTALIPAKINAIHNEDNINIVYSGVGVGYDIPIQSGDISIPFYCATSESAGVMSIDLYKELKSATHTIATLQSTITELQSKISELESKLDEKLDKDQLWVCTMDEYNTADKSDKDRFYMIKEEV